MRRLGSWLSALAVLLGCLAVCGASAPTDVPETVALPAPADGWQDSYLAFVENDYDILAALWPDGLGGVGFIDLDLDGTPEMIAFDQGASAALGAQIFDLADGQVYCVSSTLDSAAGAFDSTYLSGVSVCTSFFESFRLSRTQDGWCFWVDSSNGTDQTSWDEIVRFNSQDGVLAPVSTCYRYLEFDPVSGVVVSESYTVAGAGADATAYQAAADVYQGALDAGYEAKGVFLWDDYDKYSAGRDGLLTMVKDALTAYVPITDTVTLASPVE